MNRYRNIVFDLGGVILNLDLQRTSDAFRKLGFADFDNVYGQLKQSDVFDRFDKGHISENDFRRALAEHLPETVTAAEIDSAWNAMLLDLPAERIRFLETINKTHRIFLLSNTNEIHVRAFEAYLQQAFGFSNFNHIFEKAYYSCRIGLRKPDREIFDFVLAENNLQPAETLFIDDSPQHVEGARKAGITGFWIRDGKSITENDIYQ
jgi:putative hydrolase of the HAD superfamily